MSTTHEMRFDGQVAIVTGAGNGIGKAHAKLLAARGAKLLVNDLGVAMDGKRSDDPVAQSVADEIIGAGGCAIADRHPVQEGDRIVQAALDHFGRVDILINNAGILRDSAFHKMTDEDWSAVYEVHVLGSYKTARAVWPVFREQGYGRMVFTVSGSGIYGSFGQANYAMAKLGTHGLTQTLAIEGQRHNIHVNSVAPVAGSRLPAHLWPREVLDAVKPDYVSNLVAFLCHRSCTETGGLFEAGGGWVSRLRWHRSAGLSIPITQNWGPEEVAASIDSINDFDNGDFPVSIADAFEPVLRNLPKDLAEKWKAMTAGRWDSSATGKLGQ